MNATKRFFCLCSVRSHLNVLRFPPPTRGCSEGLGAFRFFLKQHTVWYLKKNQNASLKTLSGQTCFKKNLKASRPSEHPQIRGGDVKTFRWDHRLQIQNLFHGISTGSPTVVTLLGQQHNTGEKPTVILYTYINRHAGTPNKKQKQCSTTSNMV